MPIPFWGGLRAKRGDWLNEISQLPYPSYPIRLHFSLSLKEQGLTHMIRAQGVFAGIGAVLALFLLTAFIAGNAAKSQADKPIPSRAIPTSQTMEL